MLMPPFTRLVIPYPLYEELDAHAWNDRPNECCGLLAGTIDGTDAVVSQRFPVRNTLASPTEYHTDPRDMLAAFRLMRESGTELLAVYHSHPTGNHYPSQRDLD